MMPTRRNTMIASGCVFQFGGTGVGWPFMSSARPESGLSYGSGRPSPHTSVYLLGTGDLDRREDVVVEIGGIEKGARLVSIDLALLYFEPDRFPILEGIHLLLLKGYAGTRTEITALPQPDQHLEPGGVFHPGIGDHQIKIDRAGGIGGRLPSIDLRLADLRHIGEGEIQGCSCL